MSDLVVVFGGFRGNISIDDMPVIPFQGMLGGDFATYIDEHQDREDSLSKRLETVISVLGDCESCSTRTLHVLALSMGCHLAARFIDRVISSDNSISIGHVLLVAVGPKFRPGAQDTHGSTLGIESAFDEALQLWGDVGTPGRALTDTLNKISRETESIRLVLCHTDGIAERKNNVDRLVAAFMNNDEIRIVEAIDGQHINAFNISVKLSDNSSEAKDLDVHYRLWPAVSVRS